MNYNLSTIGRAVIAGVLALGGATAAGANGVDVSHLDLGQWLAALGTALVAAAAIFHKPDAKQAPLDKASSTVTDVVANAIQSHSDLTQTAIDNIQKVKEATGDLATLLPGPLGSVAGTAEKVIVTEAERVLGPLASQVIDRVRF